MPIVGTSVNPEHSWRLDGPFTSCAPARVVHSAETQGGRLGVVRVALREAVRSCERSELQRTPPARQMSGTRIPGMVIPGIQFTHRKSENGCTPASARVIRWLDDQSTLASKKRDVRS